MEGKQFRYETVWPAGFEDCCPLAHSSLFCDTTIVTTNYGVNILLTCKLTALVPTYIYKTDMWCDLLSRFYHDVKHMMFHDFNVIYTG